MTCPRSDCDCSHFPWNARHNVQATLWEAPLLHGRLYHPHVYMDTRDANSSKLWPIVFDKGPSLSESYRHTVVHILLDTTKHMFQIGDMECLAQSAGNHTGNPIAPCPVVVGGGVPHPVPNLVSVCIACKVPRTSPPERSAFMVADP